jgi:DNA-binding MarR family transcriptional regulator
MGFKNLSAELEELRGWSQERREGLRKSLKDQIDEYAPEDKLSLEWQSQFIEEIDSLDPCASLHFLRLIVHYLRMTSQLYKDVPREARKERKGARAIYRLHALKFSVLEHLREVDKGTVEDVRKALNKSPSELRKALGQLEQAGKVECVPFPTGGRPKKIYNLTHRKGPITPTNNLASMVVRFDGEGKESFEVPGDRTGRPPKSAEAVLISALFELLQLLGDAREDIYKDLQNILAAFCWINLSVDRIQKIIEPHPSDPS